MLNIGPMEFVAVCVIALIVLGPEKLPQALRTLGRITREVRRISGGFQNELRNALEEEPSYEEKPRYDKPRHDKVDEVGEVDEVDELGESREEPAPSLETSDNGSPDGTAK